MKKNPLIVDNGNSNSNQIYIEWSQTYGGNWHDDGKYVQATMDGGYIIVGSFYSYDLSSYVVWLIKTDASGNEQWNSKYGGSDNDYGHGVQPTPDGGYIIVGWTKSYGAGNADIWLIKTDGYGNEQWNRTYGGKEWDSGLAIQLTQDNGYIIVGLTSSFGAGENDVWLIKTDSNGVIVWSKTFGGKNDDSGHFIQNTSDGGHIISGYTKSYGEGNKDVWLIKIDSNGKEEWNQTFGGKEDDTGESVQPTPDGGYILIGDTYSNSAGYSDVLLIKTDEFGQKQWTQTFGGRLYDRGRMVQPTTDGGYIIVGNWYNEGSYNSDIWFIKTDIFGQRQWSQTFGGDEDDEGECIQLSPDGGYIVLGATSSYESMKFDIWLFKVAYIN